jgi:hypothetical protein
MLIEYRSNDTVNASVAGQYAADCGLDLCLADPRRLVPRQGVTALVYDADFIAPAVLAGLAASPAGGSPQPRLAVHGFNLDRGTVRRLRAAGVLVARRLSRRLFERLRTRLACPNEEATSSQAVKSAVTA